jgi:hypothetical protein
MTPVESLHYAIGELAYAMACTKGHLQKEEHDKFHRIVEAELRMHDPDFEVSEIIFQILEKEHADPKQAYDSAIHQLQINSHYISPKLKETFMRVIEKIAMAFPPSTSEEIEFVNKFKKELSELKGDPVYYDQK